MFLFQIDIPTLYIIIHVTKLTRLNDDYRLDRTDDRSKELSIETAYTEHMQVDKQTVDTRLDCADGYTVRRVLTKIASYE